MEPFLGYSTRPGRLAAGAVANSGSRRRGPLLAQLLENLLHRRHSAVANEALAEAHVAARIDHRSFAARGIEREPALWIPHAAFEMVRQGYRSVVAERLREEHRVRAEARLESAAERSAPQDLEAIRREARDNWLRLRREQERGEPSPGSGLDSALDPDLGR